MNYNNSNNALNIIQNINGKAIYITKIIQATVRVKKNQQVKKKCIDDTLLNVGYSFV